MNAKDRSLTPQGRERLEADLAELKTTARRERSARVAAARELTEGGDEGDATALVEAQEDQMLLELRIAELERTLAQAEVLDEPQRDDGVIRFGSTVTFRDEDGVDAYTIVGAAEANPRAGRISVTSPVGAQLMGHRAGDEVLVTAPSGTRRLKIEKVE